MRVPAWAALFASPEVDSHIFAPRHQRERIGDFVAKEFCLRTFEPRLTAVALALMLCGCAVGPDFKSPTSPTTSDHFTPDPMVQKTDSAPGLDGDVQNLHAGAEVPADWWTLFQSAELNQVVEAAIANNPTLTSAEAALKSAREQVVVARAGLFPSLTGSVQDDRERISPIVSGLPANLLYELNVAQVAVNASYNVDVFGATRRTIEANQAQVDYANFELEAAYLTLVGDVVTTAIKEASLRAQIKAQHDVLDTENHQLNLLQQQFKFGAIPKANVLTQQSQVAAVEATLPGLYKALAQNRHLLATLVGSLPSDAVLPEFTLENLHLPTEIPVSMPSDLIRQRPDLRASEAQLHTASAEIGVATAQLYPQVAITASYGREALSYSGLRSPQSTVWSLGAGLTQPLFNAGELRAKKRAAVDQYEVAQAQYRSTVLNAFENVADSLRALDTDATALRAYAESESVAQQSLKLSEAQYKLGAVSFFQLLQNEMLYQQARVSLAEAQATRLADTAALFQSLGGGWWNRKQPIAAAQGDAKTE
jgi:NodT family efflux transporter outer membrane factor (OMF) lipoprotein